MLNRPRTSANVRKQGQEGRDQSTIVNRRILAERHVIPSLGARRVVDLSAEDVDAWLADKARTLSTDTVHRLLSILRRSLHRAQGRDLVRRNVALLSSTVVTEKVYRNELRPVLTPGARTMNELFEGRRAG